MEQLIANLVGKTRRATLNGRDYIVAPLSLIVTGVLNGSKGALFYPSDEIGKDPQRWNHTPIVVYHPVVNGQNVSARDPDVLNTSGIGLVLKSHVKNGKLCAEGWFDIDATRRIDPRVLANLEAGRSIELSTGLFTTNEIAPLGSNYRGASYDYIARDYVPDHLAILPDQIGACSINDGCGVLVNKTSVENGGPGSGPRPGGGKSKGKERFSGAGGVTYGNKSDRDSDNAYFAREKAQADTDVKAAQSALDSATKRHEANKQHIAELQAKVDEHHAKGESQLKGITDRHEANKKKINEKSEARKAALDAKLKEVLGNGGIGSGKAAVESSAKLGSEHLLEGSLIADTHLDKPRVSQGSILKAFQENGFVAKNNETDGVVILASPTVITTKLQGKGWEHSHYQIKDGIRTDALSKGSNKITLTQEGAGRTVALATRQHVVANGGPGSGPQPGGGSKKKEMHSALAKRFSIPEEAVADILDNDVKELRRREDYYAPSNTTEPTTDFEKFPLNSAKIGAYGDPENSYVEVLGKFKPKDVLTAEAEDGIKTRNPSYPLYVEWAKKGSEPPPINISINGDGTIVSSNRRRVLAAQDAGVESIKGWYSPFNKETGLPLKYGDVLRASKEVTVNNQQGSIPLHSNQGETMKKLTDDERFDLIEGIVGNCKCKDTEVTTLNELSDETLTVIANKFGSDGDDEEEEPEEKVVTKNEKKPIKKQPTANAIPPQFLKGKNKKKPVEEASDDEEEAEGEMPVKNQESRLTAEEQEDLAFARSIKLNQKNEKIKTITSNVNNKFTKEQLGSMPLDVLTNMAELAKPSEEEAGPTRNQRRSNFQGAAAPMSAKDRLTANAERDQEDVVSMRPPVINYSELAKEHRQNDIGRQRTVSSAAMN